MTSQEANSGMSQEEFEYYLAQLLAQQSWRYPILTNNNNYTWANGFVPDPTNMEHLQVPTGFDVSAYGQILENGAPMSSHTQFQDTFGFHATPDASPNFNTPTMSVARSDFGLGQSPLLGPSTNYTYQADAPQLDIWANFQPVSPTQPIHQPQFPSFQMEQMDQAPNALPATSTVQQPPPSFEELLASSTPESERSPASDPEPDSPRKGNNTRGRKGNPRCVVCRKWKRKCTYTSVDSACTLCESRGWGHLCTKTLGPKAAHKYTTTPEGAVVLK